MNKLTTLLAAGAIAAAGAADARELALAYFMGPKHPMNAAVFQPFAERLEELSGGELTVRMFPGGALNSAPPKQYSILLDGVADIAFALPGVSEIVLLAPIDMGLGRWGRLTAIIVTSGVGKALGSVFAGMWCDDDDLRATAHLALGEHTTGGELPVADVEVRRVGAVDRRVPVAGGPYDLLACLRDGRYGLQLTHLLAQCFDVVGP